jgi:alpha-tubulin suppressor-like RCC1 family protein
LDPPENCNPILRQRKPWRLRWADRKNADVKHVACGNGFSLIVASNLSTQRGSHCLLGCGLNSHSQIGVHKSKSNEPYKFIIEPTLIDLNIPLSEQSKLRIRDISCGRAHSIVLTNHGIVGYY